MSRKIIANVAEFGLGLTKEERFDKIVVVHPPEVLRAALEWADNGGELPRLKGEK